ncbi:hypothetical protein JCM8547_001143 [Rhodosporidiobolus lusitaniae]
MRISSAALILALGSTAVPAVQAAPLPSFNLGSIISSVLHNSLQEVAQAIDGWNQAVEQATDAWKHGKVTQFNALSFVRKLASKRYNHSVNWSKSTKFPGWKKWKANGVNLGTWLEIETNYAPSAIPAEFNEEWTYCETVGKAVCGPVLEKHYDTWVTPSDVDLLSKYGVNTLRIPTTYAAWYDVPGSQLYHGNQQKKLRAVTEKATAKGMHVIIGLHSLPQGVNFLQIGEASGHEGWWFNQTAFDYSLKVVSGVLDFIQSSSNPSMYTIAPINEPSNSIQTFASPNTVHYPDGVNWLMTYLRAVYAMIEERKMGTWLMQNDAFMGASYWAPLWDKSDRIVIDSHFYFFAASGVYATYTGQIACGQAQAAAEVDIPIFVGEWALQSYYNNSLALRGEIFNTQLYAWQTYLQGGAFWSFRYEGTDNVSSGEGATKDYWSYKNLIADGVVPAGGKIVGSYC